MKATDRSAWFLAVLFILPSAGAHASARCGPSAEEERAGLRFERPDTPSGQLVRTARGDDGSYLEIFFRDATCQGAAQGFYTALTEVMRVEALVARDGKHGIALLEAEAGGSYQDVDHELYALLELARDFATLTNGAFDASFAVADGVWRAALAGGTAPAPEALAAAAALMSPQAIEFDPEEHRVRLAKPGMKVSLGGLARGYAIDRAVQKLRALGHRNFAIRTAGEAFIDGDPGPNDAVIAVNAPDSATPLMSIRARGRAVNISRDDVRFVQQGGKRRHPIVDPRTGFPTEETRVVALVAADGTTADALSTAVFVLGPERGLALVEARRGIEAVIVGANGRIYVSSGLSEDVFFHGRPRGGAR